jgi:hypothetical protein
MQEFQRLLASSLNLRYVRVMKETWHEYIDSTLLTLSRTPTYPDNLTLDDSLRTALTGVEAQWTSDPVASRAAKAMTDCALDPMLTDLAEGGRYPMIKHLDILRGWRDHPSALYVACHDIVYISSGYYRERGEQTHDVASALSSAAFMIRHTYPIDYENPIRPRRDKEPCPAHMQDMVGMFAVVSHVHAAECGPEKNQRAVTELAENITLITTKK